MARFARFSSALALAATLTSAAYAAHTHVATPGTWTLNLKETSFGTGPGMKSDVETVLVDTEKRLKYTDVTVDDKGKTWKTSWDGPQDGTMHPITGMSGSSTSWNAATDSGATQLSDGTVMDASLTLSPNKKKLTMQVTGRDKTGRTFTQTLVYDRTK